LRHYPYAISPICWQRQLKVDLIFEVMESAIGWNGCWIDSLEEERFS